MKKAAILCAAGFEAGETLLVTDILRWGGIEADLVTLKEKQVVGMHGITALTDRAFGDDLSDYDMLVIPGGGCAQAFMDYEPLTKLIQTFAADESKLVAGICSGLRVLHHAGILKGRRMTYKPDEANQAFFADSEFVDEVVVQDGNILTSRGPGMSFAFAYELVRALGVDAEALKERMQYARTKRSAL